MFVLQVFVGSVGGFIFFKCSYAFLFPKKLSYVLGGVVTLLLSYQIAMWFAILWLLYTVIIALLVYIWFLTVSEVESV